MADDVIRVGVELESTGTEAQLAAAISASLAKAFAKDPTAGKEYGRRFIKAFEGSGFKVIDNVLKEASKRVSQLESEMGALTNRMNAVASAAAAQRKAFGTGFDPRNLDAFESSLSEIVRTIDEIARTDADPTALRKVGLKARAVQAELTATRTAAQQSTLAQREAFNAQARDANQVSRERIALKKAETARYVTETQTAAARELAVIRGSTQQQVALTQAAAKRRAATFQLIATAARSAERVIRSAFDGTSNVVSSAFNSMRRAATTTTTNIRQSFTNSNSAIRNSVSNSNAAISNNYRQSWSRNTSTVNNELGKQETRVRQFAREASEEISTIGIGRIAGFAALGVAAGKALSLGFTRAATLETAQLALTQLLGSAEEAKGLLDEVTEVVTGTPFALDQFASATSRLIAYNVEAAKIPDILRAVGDAAALAGPESAQAFDSILRSIGQINTVGRANLEEIKVIAEAGVPAFKILGNELGVTTEQLRELFEQGAVPAGVAIDALVKGISQGTDGVNGPTAAFGGLAKQLGDTLAGSVANFRTAIARAGEGVITALKEPFVEAVGAATAAIDLLGVALKSVATAFANSALTGLLVDGVEAITRAFKEAKNELVPFFDFISGGIVIMSQLAAALFVFKRIPAVLRGIGAAFKFILTPTNLLVAAGVLVTSYFKQLYDDSADLRTALGEVGGAIQRIATVVKDLALDAFDALTGGAAAAGEGAGSLADTVLGFVVPALERLANFLIDDVLPPIRDFARFVRTDVLPAIGNFLATAVDRALEAFEALSDFVKDEVVPVVGPILERAVDIARTAFENLYEFLSGTLLPFIKSNLTPVLAGLAVGLGALALSGGNLPLAGLVGVGAGVGAALANDDIRAQVFAFFDDLVDGIRERLGNIFTGDNLKAVFVGALKVAERIGRVIGDALSGRRLVTIVSIAAGAAAAVAAAFVVGFGRGIIENLPDLIDLLTDSLSAAFQAAFDAITKDPKIAAAVVGGILGAATLAKLVLSGRQAGKVLATALAQGAVSAGSVGGGSGASGFLTGVFGGPTAVRQEAARIGQQAGQSLVTAIRNEARVVDLLGGTRQSNLRLGRVAGESFVDQNRRLSGQLQDLTAESGRLSAELGKAATAGVRLSDGLRLVASGNIKQGFAQLSTSVKAVGREAGKAAGILAGAAFAASFVSQALFDVNASGKDKLASALGTIAIGAGTGQQLGGAKGAAIGAGLGAAVAAFGILTTRVDENKKALERAAAAADTYRDALKGITSQVDATDAFKTQFQENLRATEDVAAALDDAGFKFEQIQEVLNSQRTGGSFIADVKAQLRDAGIEGQLFDETLQFITDQLDGFRIASAAEGDIQNIFTSTKQDAETAKGAIDVANTATQAFRDRVAELNEARIDGLKSRVDEAKTALNNAGTAADEAKEKLRQFLAGETAQSTLTQQVNDAIIGVANIASGLEGLDLTLIKDKASFDNQVAEVQSQVASILSEAQPATPEELAGLVDPLRTAIEQEDLSPDITAALQAGIDAAVTAFNTDDAKGLLTGLFDAQALETELQTALTDAETKLQIGIEVDPLSIPLIASEAKAAFDSAGGDAVQGFADGVEGSTAAKDAARTMAEDALAEAEAALGISSPSTKFAAFGRFSAEGYAQGIKATQGIVFNASRQVGQFAMQGFRTGILLGATSVIEAARNVARAAAEAMRAELEVSSPSKVTSEIGEFFGEGLAEGIDDSTSSVLTASVRLAKAALQGLTTAGQEAAKAIGRGFAEDGAGFIGSVSSAMDKAYEAALSKADQFKVIGQEIASNLFANQGTGPLGIFGGGSAQARLATSGLDILGLAGDFAKNTEKLFEEFGFDAISFGLGDTLGRANQKEFLDAGLRVREYGEQLLQSGVAADEVVKRLQPLRDQLIAVANARGLSAPINAGVLDEMLRSLGLTNDQLAQFVTTVNDVARAAQAATTAEQQRIAAEQAAEEAATRAEERAKEAEERAREEAERIRREYTLQAPAFRDLIVQSPSGDPEAVALATANRVAFAIRR